MNAASPVPASQVSLMCSLEGWLWKNWVEMSCSFSSTRTLASPRTSAVLRPSKECRWICWAWAGKSESATPRATSPDTPSMDMRVGDMRDGSFRRDCLARPGIASDWRAGKVNLRSLSRAEPGRIRSHRTAGRRRVRTLKGPKKGAKCVVFAPDGESLAASYYDGSIRLWDLREGTLTKLCGGGLTSKSLIWTPDGKKLFWTISPYD